MGIAKLKKTKLRAEAAETALFSIFLPVHRMAEGVISAGGHFALLLAPILDALRLRIFWLRHQDADKQKQDAKRPWRYRANLSFYVSKLMASVGGIGYASAGFILKNEAMVALGFTAVIAVGFLAAAHYFAKALYYQGASRGWWQTHHLDVHTDLLHQKMVKNLEKGLLNGMIAGGFLMYVQFPETVGSVFGYDLVWAGFMLAMTAMTWGLGRIMQNSMAAETDDAGIATPASDSTPSNSPVIKVEETDKLKDQTTVSFDKALLPGMERSMSLGSDLNAINNMQEEKRKRSFSY